MAEHSVVAVDGSDASADAIEQAVALARQRQMALAGIFVVDGGWPDFIGNDRQSAKGARQGFLDHIRAEQKAQAEAARVQFQRAAESLPRSAFQAMAGDPAEVLLSLAGGSDTAMLVASKRVFQVSGRYCCFHSGEPSLFACMGMGGTCATLIAGTGSASASASVA